MSTDITIDFDVIGATDTTVLRSRGVEAEPARGHAVATDGNGCGRIRNANQKRAPMWTEREGLSVRQRKWIGSEIRDRHTGKINGAVGGGGDLHGGHIQD